MFGIVYVVFHVNMTLIHSEPQPHLLGGHHGPGTRGGGTAWGQYGHNGAVQLLEQPWSRFWGCPPSLRTAGVICTNTQPRSTRPCHQAGARGSHCSWRAGARHPAPSPSYHSKATLISKKRLISCNKIRTFRKLIG